EPSPLSAAEDHCECVVWDFCGVECVPLREEPRAAARGLFRQSPVRTTDLRRGASRPMALPAGSCPDHSWWTTDAGDPGASCRTAQGKVSAHGYGFHFICRL